MEEEKVTTEQTTLVEKKESNKKIKLFLYIVIFAVAIIGIVLAVNGIDFKFNEEEPYSEVEQDNNNNYEDKEVEDEEDVIGNMDPYISQIDFKVDKDDRETLINSTNCSACLNGNIYGEMYKDEISNNFKLLYTAHKLWIEVQEITGTTENYADFYGDVSISEKLLLENAKKIFANVEIPTTFNENMFYMGTTSLKCNNGTCTFNQSTFGTTGISPFSGYENKLTIEGNNIRVDQIYIEDEFINYNETNDTYLFDLKLYDKKDGTVIKEFKSYEINLSNELDIYAEFSQYYDKVQSYIYKFDENNRLLEVTKVDE